MAPSAHFKQLVERCNHIASEISDDNGFVSILKLVRKFDAEIIFRPLLVEGMIASALRKDDQTTPNGHQWWLLIDSETYMLKDSELTTESFGSPLPARFRNTVAHELVHSLTFRNTEFGVKFPIQQNETKRRAFVKEIERDTEKLSPLLLVPDEALDQLFTLGKVYVDIEELSRFRKSLGISRFVLVNRLNLLRVSDEKRLRVHRRSLRNTAIGIGEWSINGDAILKADPLYSFFDGGKVPSFIFQLQRRIDVSANGIFGDANFVLNGGLNPYTESVVSVGTPTSPNLAQVPIRCAVESGAKKHKSKFLFVIY